MSEKNLNFDQLVDRRGTHSLKYDFAEARGRKADILPLWVADMDFRTSSFVQDALCRQVEHGVYGYTESDDEYYNAVNAWMERRHGWKIEKDWIVKTPGIVFALAMAVKAYTEPGDYVLIQNPVYYPFREVIEANDREVADNVLVQKEDGSYEIDFEDFERQIVEKHVKLFLFCSPHNPVSRVWTKEEIERLGDICLKHHVIIVSDEIHADFVFEGKHQVLVDLKEEYKDITVTCTSPGKTFNLAGLQISNIVIPNEALRKAFHHQVTAAGYSQVGAPGIFALIAAYTEGEEWYQAMKRYVKSNIDFTHNWIKENLPQIKVTKTEGTYLVWMDFRALGLSDSELKDLIEKKAEVWLDGGEIFGESGRGFERINVACQRETLVEALNRIKKAIEA
nr:MalY/PatB family protein [uncultured Mediterraneibacter sp.]